MNLLIATACCLLISTSLRAQDLTLSDLSSMPLQKIYRFTDTEIDRFMARRHESENEKLAEVKLAFRRDSLAITHTAIDVLEASQPLLAQYFRAKAWASADSVEKATACLYALDNSAPHDELIREMNDDYLPQLDKAERKAYRKSDDKLATMLRFWRANDPTPATEENEFWVSQIQRLDYVRRHFRFMSGLDDRGKIWLRYGEPDKRHIYPHYNHESECWVYYNLAGEPAYFDFLIHEKDNFYRRIENLNRIYGDKYYPSVAPTTEASSSEKNFMGPPIQYFYFDRQNLSKHYAAIATDCMAAQFDKKPGRHLLNSGSAYLGMAANRVRNQLHLQNKRLPRSVVHLPWFFIPLNFDVARFKSTDGRIRVESYLGLAMEHFVAAFPEDSTMSMRFNRSILLKDTDFALLQSDKGQVDIGPIECNELSSSVLIDQKNWLLDPDNIAIGVEYRETRLRLLSTAQRSLSLNTFLSDSLFISDIQFASSISPGTEQPGSLKSGLKVHPYPIQVFQHSMMPFIYFEIYNLSLKPHTRYSVEYTVETIEHFSGIKRFFSGKEKRTAVVSTAFESSGSTADEAQYFRLDLSRTTTGDCALIIKVTDLYTGQIFQREKKFMLL